MYRVCDVLNWRDEITIIARELKLFAIIKNKTVLVTGYEILNSNLVIIRMMLVMLAAGCGFKIYIKYKSIVSFKNINSCNLNKP